MVAYNHPNKNTPPWRDKIFFLSDGFIHENLVHVCTAKISLVNLVCVMQLCNYYLLSIIFWYTFVFQTERLQKIFLCSFAFIFQRSYLDFSCKLSAGVQATI